METIKIKKHPRGTQCEYKECNERAVLIIFLFGSFSVILINLCCSILNMIGPIDELVISWYWYFIYWITKQN